MGEQPFRTKMNADQIRGLPEAIQKIAELEEQVGSLNKQLNELKNEVVTQKQLEALVESAKKAYERGLAGD